MRIRFLLTLLALVAFFSPKAQQNNMLPVGHLGFIQGYPFFDHTQFTRNTPLDQKWHFSKYASLSAGTTFFTGGSAFFPGAVSFISAPIGLQLNRALNNNLYAFTGISAAPTFFSLNSLYTDPIKNSSYPGYNPSRPYGLGLNPRVEMGLMYVNDAKTFSISGSVGVERDSYPIYPYPANTVNAKRQ